MATIKTEWAFHSMVISGHERLKKFPKTKQPETVSFADTFLFCCLSIDRHQSLVSVNWFQWLLTNGNSNYMETSFGGKFRGRKNFKS